MTNSPMIEEKIDTLMKKLIHHEKAIVLIRLEINKILYAPDEQSATPAAQAVAHKGEKSLDQLVHETLLVKPLTMAALVKDLLNGKYKTKSKNFTNVLQQSLLRLHKCGAIKKHTQAGPRQYSSVAMSGEELKKRLSSQSQQKKITKA